MKIGTCIFLLVPGSVFSASVFVTPYSFLMFGKYFLLILSKLMLWPSFSSSIIVLYMASVAVVAFL